MWTEIVSNIYAIAKNKIKGPWKRRGYNLTIPRMKIIIGSHKKLLIILLIYENKYKFLRQ